MTQLLSPRLLYATKILDKTQGSFQKGVTLSKSVVKATLIRLLNVTCFLVVARRGKNIFWPLRSCTCGHSCTHALHNSKY